MTSLRVLAALVVMTTSACSSSPGEVDSGTDPSDSGATADATPTDGTPIDALDVDAIDAFAADAGDIDALICQLIDAGAPVDMCEGAALEPDNDACPDAIDLTFGVQCGGAFRYGDTTGYLGDLEPAAACTNDFTLDGPDAVYRVPANAGQVITASVVPDHGFDAGLYILSDCLSSADCLDGSDAGLGGAIETVQVVAPTTGTYYVVVDSWSPGAEGCYSLSVTVE